jgi:hypothetical protein
MGRKEKEFLSGFERAAILTKRILASPPTYTSAEEYVEDVVDLHANSEDLISRGLVVGCLSALGKG